jgi:hypothetical protein
MEIKNKHQKIAAENIYHAFNWIVGGYYNNIQDGVPECIPDEEQEIKDEIYDSAMKNLYRKGYEGFDKAPKEMRFAGSQFCRQYIDELWKSDEDVKEISEEKGW